MRQKSPNAVYLRGNCQLHSGFSYDKSPGLVFRLNHKISKQICLVFLFMEKMLLVQFHSMEKFCGFRLHLEIHDSVDNLLYR